MIVLGERLWREVRKKPVIRRIADFAQHILVQYIKFFEVNETVTKEQLYINNVLPIGSLHFRERNTIPVEVKHIDLTMQHHL